MADSGVWDTIHAERGALAADLAGLTEEQWASPSLCAEWSVQEVLAHMTATAQMTPPKFFSGLVSSRFRFNDFNARNVAHLSAGSPANTLAAFRGELDSTAHPPGPLPTWLGETIVHAEDIREPLGISHDYPHEALTRVADFYKGSNPILHSKDRITGLTLRAIDVPWSTGSGPEVTGPILSLVLAMTGRSAALEDLTGDGLDMLRGRM